MTALANALALRHLKVLLKLFQKLTVSKGRAFGRRPQTAKNFWAKPNILLPPKGRTLFAP